MTSEFLTIRDLFAPLAHPQWGRGLVDDVAVVPSRQDHDLVLTKDALVEGVHFLSSDPLGTVAQKLLRVNLSDLAAKGSEPFGYLLACSWSGRCGWSEREAFVRGLAEDQAEFGIALLGGDTVSTPGPATFSATMMGWIPKDAAVGRNGARPGDIVFVTGRVGNGWLGLMAAQGRMSLDQTSVDDLIDHYRRPMPQTAFAQVIRTLATASVDVSDGLIADVGHVASASGVRINIDLERTPLSSVGQQWLQEREDIQAGLLQLVTGGDDYEIAFTVRAEDVVRLHHLADGLHVRITPIGEVAKGQGVELRYRDTPVPVAVPGWVHG